MEPIQRGYTAVAVLKYQLEAASGTVALIARTESIIPNKIAAFASLWRFDIEYLTRSIVLFSGHLGVGSFLLLNLIGLAIKQ